MNRDVVIRVIVKLVLPFMLLFALYVQFHGELGPGGGFQAGVITAGMVILYALIFGVDAAKRIAMYQDMQKGEVQQSPTVHLFQQMSIAVTKANVSGVSLGLLFDATRYDNIAK